MGYQESTGESYKVRNGTADNHYVCFGWKADTFCSAKAKYESGD